MTGSSSRLIFLAIFLMAGAAILYELILAAVLSYLLGATVLYFSLTIGIFLFALGMGARLSRRLGQNLIQKFLTIEVILGILGGLSVPLIFFIYSLLFSYLGGHIFNNLFSFLFQAGWAEIIFNGLAFAVIFIIGLLVGIELPVFTRLANESLVLKEALARVFFWDYAGSLAGAVLFSLLLLPGLGFLRTGFLVGLINLAAAAVLAVGMAQAQAPGLFSLLSRALLVTGFSALIIGFALTPSLEQFFTQKIFAGNDILWDQTSPYQRIQLIKNGEGQISLFLNGELQFQSGLLDRRYHKTFARPVMSFLGERVRRVLILGGGDGLLLREIWKYRSVAEVTLVDIDPMMTNLAKTHPALVALNENAMNNPRLALINDDAFRWLLHRSSDEPRFDAIFIDLPDPADDALRRLYSQEFYLMVRRNLSPDGLAVVQAGSLPSRQHEIIRKTLKSAGFRTLAFHPEGEDPALGIPGVFETSFVAASPSPESIDRFYQFLGSAAEFEGIITPYLDSKLAQASRPYSLFKPLRSFGPGGSLTSRLIEVQMIPSDIFSHFRAPRELVKQQIRDIVAYDSIFSLP